MPHKTIKQASDLVHTNSERQIRSASDLVGMSWNRSVLITREAIDAESRTVNLAFATETPCQRYYGFEILDCKPESVRLDRLNSRAPILMDHDPCKQVGVIDKVMMDKDRVGRVVSRYSRSERGQEIFQDIIDEIRTNTSVGYMVHEAVLEKEVDGICYYRITDWEPYEVSIVSMPADITCGVGRSLDPTEANNEQKPLSEKENTPMETVDTGAVERAATEREQKRVADIMAAGKEYAARGGVEVAAGLISDPKATADTFRAKMLDKITAEQAAGTTREPDSATRTIATTSLRYDKRSLEPFMRGAGGTTQQAERAAYESGMWARAVLFGDANAERWCKDNGLDVRVMTSASGSAGGFLVPDVLEGAIIDLRAEYGVARRLAEFVPMSSGSCEYPVRKTGTTAYFPGQQSATTESDMEWGQAALVAKEVSALSRISISLSEDAIIDLGAKVADEHAYAFAVKEDSCMIDGDGTSTYGGIVGLKAKLETSGMAGIYTTASGSDTPAEIIAAELSGVMGKLPSYARKGSSFVVSPEFDELIFGRLMAAAGGNTTATLAGEIMPAYLGRPRVVCEPCYSDPTADLTGKAFFFFGNFRQGVLFGERRGITVQVLRERYAEYRQIGVIGTERIDINCHGVGDTSTRGPIVALIGG